MSALAAFALALVLGRFLGEKADSTRPSESGSESSSESLSESPAIPPERSEVPAIDGVFVGLEGITDNTYSEVAKQIPDTAAAVSMSLFYSNGAPYYSSEAAEAFGNPAGELTLKNVFGYAKENGIYISVPFRSKALASHSALTFGAAAAYELELMRELYLAGADEVIVIPHLSEDGARPSISDSEYASKVAEYLSDIKRELPKLRIGYALTYDELADDGAAAAISEINGRADLLAADLTEFSEASELEEAAREIQVKLMRYGMRVLIGGGDRAELCASLDLLGLKNRQMMTKGR